MEDKPKHDWHCMCKAPIKNAMGHVLLNPALFTPHEFPVFMRATVMRIVAGSLLLAGVFVGCVALTVDDSKSKLSCALSCATCIVACWHYKKLISIREQSGVRMRLSKPGEAAAAGQPPVELTLAWQEIAADSVRYSDWLVTLTPLIIDLHILNGEHTALFPIAWSPILCTLMVTFGAFTRIGTDELVPPSNCTKSVDGIVRIVGLVSFALSSACLVLVLYNLLHGLEDDPSNGWVAAFSLPWLGYGIVTMVAIVWRQFQPNGYPEALSVLKDVAFGTLDVYSKAIFAFYVASTALGSEALMFRF